MDRFGQWCPVHAASLILILCRVEKEFHISVKFLVCP